MINSLDEAIAHCEEVAENQEWMAKNYDDDSMGAKVCRECASERRQLAEWLRELKALHENEDVKDVFNNCETCKYRDIDDTYGYICDKCMHRYRNQYVYDDKREVNADDK